MNKALKSGLLTRMLIPAFFHKSLDDLQMVDGFLTI